MSRSHPFTRFVFRQLLRVYPRAFRARHEAELVTFFEQQLDEARQIGYRSIARVWLDTIADLLRATWRLRLHRPEPLPLNATEEAPTMTIMPTVLRDAWRSTRRSWTSLVTAAATLALGVAATTSVFSLVDGVLLRRLPYPDADALVSVGMTIGDRQYRFGPASVGHLFDLQDRVTGLSGIAASQNASLTMTGGPEPRIVTGLRVTGNFFELLGATPSQGRLLGRSDTAPDAPPALVLSERGWRDLFGGRPDVVGDSLVLDGVPLVVAGIVDGGFAAPAQLGRDTALVYLPLRLHGGEGTRSSFSLQAVGRLADGYEPAAAEREVEDILARVSAELHPAYEVHGFVSPLRESVLGSSIGSTLLLAQVAVMVLLVISCANVSHLLLMRGLDRRREFSVRQALGADRRRLLAQLIGEGAFVGLAGGAVGALLAYAGVRAFVAFGPGGIPRLGSVTVDLRVLSVSMTAAIAAAIVAAWMPALMTTRLDPVAALRDGGRSLTASRSRRRLQGVLATGAVACATLLVLCAALFGRSFSRLTSVDPGFDADGLATIKLTMREGDADEWEVFYADLRERVNAIPGVASVAVSSGMPFTGEAVGARMWPGTWQDGDPDPGFTMLNHISPGYFSTMRIPLRDGRSLRASDAGDAPPVAVVNEAWVKAFMPDADRVIGATVWSGRPDSATGTPLTIVGVVGNTRIQLASEPPATVFVPIAQDTWRAVSVTARTSGDPTALLAPMRDALWSLAPTLPVDRSALVNDLRAASITEERFYAALIAVFSLVALLLAAAGVYSTVSSAVRLMTRDIGVRLALGAAPGRMRTFVLHRGVRPAIVGIALGVIGMLAVGRLLQAHLFDIAPSDPVTLLAVPLLLVAVAAGACLLPAIRAGRTDPRSVLSES